MANIFGSYQFPSKTALGRYKDNCYDNDDCNTPSTSRIDETTLTSRLRQKVKRDKAAALYRHLNVTGDLDLMNLNRLNYTKYTKKSTTVL